MVTVTVGRRLDNLVEDEVLDVSIRSILIGIWILFHSTHSTITTISAELKESSKHVDSLSRQLIGKSEVSIAAHSLRAVPISAAEILCEWANQQQIAFHIYLEEQPRRWRTIVMGFLLFQRQHVTRAIGKASAPGAWSIICSPEEVAKSFITLFETL
uniref:Uncharacterized protein n=1 Tax=Ditylenchus dipsaci TaxID=166011 RepID=A0A915D0E3_9BILA